MRELFRTTNPAEIALLKSFLTAADIKVFVFDENTNSMGLMYSYFAPCRFMVLDDEYPQAVEILKEYNLKIEKDKEPSPAFSKRKFSSILLILAWFMGPDFAIFLSNYITRRRYKSRKNTGED